MRVCLLLGGVALSAARSGAGPFSYVSDSEKLTAVSSKQLNGYTRARLADGSFEPETYSFGEGGEIPPPAIAGLVTYDPSIDRVGFNAIARMIAVPLAGQNYIPGHDPNATKLLIMVFWGRNIGSIKMLDGMNQDSVNAYNAKLMGFDSGAYSEMSFYPSIAGFGTDYKASLFRESRYDVMDALRVNRYFVIMLAYDFQSAWRQKKLVELWETRFSLSERQHDFKEDLPRMAQTASLYFGQESNGLVQIRPIPAGRVDIGDLKSLGEVPEK